MSAKGTSAEPAAVYVRGDDPSLVAQEARSVIERLVGDRDVALVVEEHGGTDELDVGVILDAATTPPFLVDRRVVVVRDAGRLSAADATRLVAALAQPVPSVHLVLVAGGGTVPTSLVKAVTAAGAVIDTSVGRGRERTRWLTEQLHDGPVRLDAAAGRRLELHLGEDLGRLSGLLDSLAAAYGEGASIGPKELEPFLGEAGAVPPWELTDAVDAGDVGRALRALHRMLGAGGRAAPLIINSLHTHFSNMLRLDGADVRSGEDAASVLGARSAFVAKKALERSRQLGGERVGQAIEWIADADLDVKGATGLSPDLVLEVLVARLARLAGRGRSGGGGRTAGSGSRGPIGR
jgi:DNA polymerase III subunit delta